MLEFPAAHRKEILELGGAISVTGNRFLEIFREGDESSFLYLLESGLVKICARGSGDQEIVLRVLGPGGVFGLAGLLGDSPRTAHAVALSRVNIMAVPRGAVLDYCRHHPDFWAFLAKLLADHQAGLYRKIRMLVLHDVRYRLLSCLIELSEICGPDAPGSPIYSIPLSQEDLALIIGATRETTSNKLNELARRKLVILGRRRVVIGSLDNLRADLDGRFSAIA